MSLLGCYNTLGMISQWVLLAILAGLASNGYNFLNRFVLKEKGDATSWAWFFETARLFIFVFLAFFDFRVELSLYSFMLLLGLGLTEFISVFLYMKMHAYSHLSVSTILSRTRLIWIPILVFLFLQQTLRPSEYIGIVILFIGISIVVAPHKFFIDKGAMYANGAAFFIAVNTIILKLLVPYASSSVIMIAMCLPSAILFPTLMKNSTQRLLVSAKEHFQWKIVAVVISIIASYLLVFALRTGDVSKVNAIYQSMMVFSVLGGIIFLKEREDIVKKCIGVALTIIGAILLA